VELRRTTMSPEPVPEGLDPRIAHRDVSVEVEGVHLDRMTHQSTVREFTVSSDEPPSLGGENEHPYPLDYFGVGVVT
jgi:hypothetical protein